MTSGASIALACLLALCALRFHHADDWLLYLYAVGGAMISVLAVGRLNLVQLAGSIWGFILGFLAVVLASMVLVLIIFGHIVLGTVYASR